MNTETSGLEKVAIILLLVSFALNLLAFFMPLYTKYWWFDDTIHTYTLFSLTLAIVPLLFGKVLKGINNHNFLLFLIMVSIGLAIGSIWEILEWVYDNLQAPNVIKGKDDTIMDLILDTIGASVASLIVLWKYSKKE